MVGGVGRSNRRKVNTSRLYDDDLYGISYSYNVVCISKVNTHVQHLST